MPYVVSLRLFSYVSGLGLEFKLGTVLVSVGIWYKRMCRSADMQMLEFVKCREILRRLSADLTGKVQRCGCRKPVSSTAPLH